MVVVPRWRAPRARLTARIDSSQPDIAAGASSTVDARFDTVDATLAEILQLLRDR